MATMRPRPGRPTAVPASASKWPRSAGARWRRSATRCSQVCRVDDQGDGPMKPVAPNALDAQLFGLSTLVQLLKRARHAASAEELGFVMVNETHALLPYRQAALWQRNAAGAG